MQSVLIVDDDVNQCLLYEGELKCAGYQVLVAHDAWAALTLCDEAKPDIVVLDINMPGMDGIDAMNRMLAHNHRLPIILHTAYEAYRESYRAWSADAYVVKSSDLAELKKTIKRVLDSREGQR